MQESVSEKILYEFNPNVPDNYIPPHFLQSLRTNVNVRRPEFCTLVASAAIAACPCSTVLLFVGLYVHMLLEHIAPSHIITANLILSVILSTLWLRILVFRDIKRTFKSTILFVSILFGVSPILRTLTLEISSDTIWAISTLLFTAHVFLTDFSPSRQMTLRFSATFSTNSAIFASVILSSRLPTMHHVFALLLTAVGLFALFPIFRRNLAFALPNPWIPLWINLTLACFSIQLFWTVSIAAVCAVIGMQFLFLILSPIILLYAHDRYKSTVNGPWDEAKLRKLSDGSLNSP